MCRGVIASLLLQVRGHAGSSEPMSDSVTCTISVRWYHSQQRERRQAVEHPRWQRSKVVGAKIPGECATHDKQA